MVNRKAKGRPFVKVYWDLLGSDVLKTRYQKIIYVYLKFFADTDNRCSPSIKDLAKLAKVSTYTVKLAIKELVEMGLVTKERRVRPDGGYDSNLYIIKDSAETWGTGDKKDCQRPFVKVYKDILTDERFSSCYEVLVYICLWRFTDEKWKCCPGDKTLAHSSGVGSTKFRETIVELQKKGLIDKRGRQGKYNGKNTNLYTLLDIL